MYCFLNSQERRQARYERRKRKREEARKRRNDGYNFDTVSSFGSIRRSYYQARKGVNWKASVQRYGCNVLRNAYNYSRKVKAGASVTRGFIEFDLHERGKTRHIKSVHITERVVQKSVCDYGIVPVMEKSLIHANGASQKGKGTQFAAEGLMQDLRHYYRKNRFSNEGYILLGDEHDFFGSIRHDVVQENMDRMIADKRLVDLTMKFITPFDRGLGLGSQVCQINAVAYQNRIDHYIKEVLRCKWYGRYMDDWYIISSDKEFLKECRRIIQEMYLQIGIQQNEKKTRIVKLSHSFEWLQDKYFLTAGGKVIRKPNRKNITRNRRKLKKLARLLEEGQIDYEAIRRFYASYRGYMMHKNGYRTKKNMDKLHNELIIRRWTHGQVSVSEQGQRDCGYHGRRKAG